MRVSFFIFKRLSSQKGKSRVGSSRLIVNLATAAVAISIMVMILSIAIVKGYQLQVRNKLIGFNSPIQVTHLDLNNSFENLPIERDSLFEKNCQKTDGIKWVQTFTNKAGIIKTNEAFEGILLKGIEPNYNWNFIQSHLKAGRIPNLAANTPEILVAASTAKKLNLKLKQSLFIYFVDNPPRVRKFIVSGIFDTGLNELDERYAFCKGSLIRQLNKWPDNFVSGYEIDITDYTQIENQASIVEGMTSLDRGVKTIFQNFPQLFDWLNLLDMNVWIILILMTLVAGINMVTALLILIVERSKMIGILKAMGARDKQIRELFILLSGGILMRGILIGNFLGLGLAWAQQKWGLIALNESAYYLNTVPIDLQLTNFIWVNLGAAITCFFFLLIPVRFVSKVDPIKTIRFN